MIVYRDITGFMTWFLAQMVRLFSWFYSLLGSITFFGTSLLQYIITLMVLSVVLQIIVISVRTRAVREVSKDDKANKKGQSDDNK